MTPVEEFDALATEIRARRRASKVWVERVALNRSTEELERVALNPKTEEPARARADAFVASLGLTPIGEHWLSRSRSEAKRYICRILEGDMAGGRMMLPAESSRLATSFLGFFHGHYDSDDYGLEYFTNGFFTNGDLMDDRRVGWSCGWGGARVTDATFDSGIIVVSPDTMGMIWVEDED